MVLKELARRNQLHSPHGKITVGVLLLQDFVVIAILATVPTLLGQPGARQCGFLAAQFVHGERHRPAHRTRSVAVAAPCRRRPVARGLCALRPSRERRHRLPCAAARPLDALESGVITAELWQILLGASVLTMAATPFVISAAASVGGAIGQRAHQYAIEPRRPPRDSQGSRRDSRLWDRWATRGSVAQRIVGASLSCWNSTGRRFGTRWHVA